jgi:hypothetical protein
MTQEQIDELKKYVDKQLHLLRRLKQENFNDQWTDEFNELVIETRDKIKSNTISFWVASIVDTSPKTRQQLQDMAQIRQVVNEAFNPFWATDGGEAFDRY